MGEQILFRASGIGALMTESRGSVITESQLKDIETLTYEMENGINANGNKVKWTETKANTLQALIDKKNAPPTLSDTAKRFIEKMWLLNKKGFYKNLDNRYIQKGLFGEEDSIGLVSDVEDDFYTKNTERKTIGHITGECDINVVKNGVRIIKDVKNSWDPETFMAGDLNSLYEWQGRTYLYLYDADEFHLHYTLNDCPPHLYENEVWKLRNKYGITDPDTPEAKPLFDQLRRNLIFSDNPNYTKEERVKTFIIQRDLEKEKALLAKIGPAVDYYNSIKLNQI